MRIIPEPIIRFCDVILKALVVLPLSGFVLYVISRDRTLRQWIAFISSPDEFGLTLLFIFIIVYGTWSAMAVYRRRRTAKNSYFWALAAFVIWMVGIPGFASGQRKMAESQGRRNLHSVRDALTLYREIARSPYPPSLEALTVGGHLAAIPPTKLPNYHDDTSRVTLGKTPDDSAGWLYDPALGRALVNCTHTDSRGTAWNAY